MKIALVTGGSRGIGRAICEELHKKGYFVLINYVSNDAAAADCLQAIEGEGELLKFDVGNPEAVTQALEQWQKAHPEEYIEQCRHPQGQSPHLAGAGGVAQGD